MENNPTHKAKTPNGQWIEGWYDGSDSHDLVMWIKGSDLIKHLVVDPTTLCRSTYRADSNGKMMYEGDEVLLNNVPHTIIWDDDRCSFKMIDIHDLVVQFHPSYRYTLTGKNKHD
jgi:hypothetical protein